MSTLHALELSAFLFYIIVNLGIAEWNYAIVKQRQKVGNTNQINHFLWAGIYAAVCVPDWFITHSWCHVASVALLHLSAFPVEYNVVSGLEWFHLSTTSKAITDQLQVKLGLRSSALVNLGAFAGCVYLLIISILHR